MPAEHSDGGDVRECRRHMPKESISNYCTEVAVALLATKAPSFTLGKGKLEEFHGSIHHAFIPRCADYVVLGEQGH